MYREEVLLMCSERFEMDGYVIVNGENNEDPFFEDGVFYSEEELKSFMTEKHPESEFIFVNDLKIFVSPEAYGELEEVLDDSFGYFMNIATDYKVALRMLEELEDNYRTTCFENGKLVVIENGKVIKGVVTKQNKKVVNKEVKGCGLKEKITLKLDEKGNLVRKNCVMFD